VGYEQIKLILHIAVQVVTLLLCVRCSIKILALMRFFMVLHSLSI